MHDTAHSELLILEYVIRLRLEWGVLQLTLINRSDEVQFTCFEVSCVVAHSQMIF